MDGFIDFNNKFFFWNQKNLMAVLVVKWSSVGGGVSFPLCVCVCLSVGGPVCGCPLCALTVCVWVQDSQLSFTSTQDVDPFARLKA